MLDQKLSGVLELVSFISTLSAFSCWTLIALQPVPLASYIVVDSNILLLCMTVVGSITAAGTLGRLPATYTGPG